jgi:hypothetical protein
MNPSADERPAGEKAEPLSKEAASDDSSSRPKARDWHGKLVERLRSSRPFGLGAGR